MPKLIHGAREHRFKIAFFGAVMVQGLMTNPEPNIPIADKGYDANCVRDYMEYLGGAAVIPTRKGRKVTIAIDSYIYAVRNQVERAFNKLKCARRLATQCDEPKQAISPLYTSYMWCTTIFI